VHYTWLDILADIHHRYHFPQPKNKDPKIRVSLREERSRTKTIYKKMMDVQMHLASALLATKEETIE
jgi:hypothetical protein